MTDLQLRMLTAGMLTEHSQIVLFSSTNSYHLLWLIKNQLPCAYNQDQPTGTCSPDNTGPGISNDGATGIQLLLPIETVYDDGFAYPFYLWCSALRVLTASSVVAISPVRANEEIRAAMFTALP